MAADVVIVMAGEDGSAEQAEWRDVSYPRAYHSGALLTVRDSDPPQVVGDFRHLPGRVWRSPHGQEIRVFLTSPGCWQWTVDGMDVTDGTCHVAEEDAHEQAHASTDGPYGRYADFPLWTDPQ